MCSPGFANWLVNTILFSRSVLLTSDRWPVDGFDRAHSTFLKSVLSFFIVMI